MNLRISPANCRLALAAALLTAGLTLGALAQGARLSINGHPASHPPIVSNGETYVAVSDLKAAGAQVTSTAGGLSIRFKPDEGGANQIGAVEGTRNEWLFNGIWRLRVGAVTPVVKPYSDGTPGWSVSVEIRNGANKEVSMQNTGMQVPTLALSNGTVLVADEGDWQQVCFRALLPGAAVTHELKFYFPHGTPQSGVTAAARLVMPVDVKSGLLRDTGLRYSVGAPSIRVTLK